MLSRSLKGHGYSRAVSEGNVPALAAGKDGLERLVKNKGKLRQRTSGLKPQWVFLCELCASLWLAFKISTTESTEFTEENLLNPDPQRTSKGRL